MKGPSLIKIKKDLAKAIKDKDPNIKSPKITKVGLIDLMPEGAADRIKDIAGFTADSSTEFAGDINNYDKMIKRMAIDWFKQQRRK
jgi:hypothetical protein